jgi:hypothetical protein
MHVGDPGGGGEAVGRVESPLAVPRPEQQELPQGGEEVLR